MILRVLKIIFKVFINIFKTLGINIVFNIYLKLV